VPTSPFPTFHPQGRAPSFYSTTLLQLTNGLRSRFPSRTKIFFGLPHHRRRSSSDYEGRNDRSIIAMQREALSIQPDVVARRQIQLTSVIRSQRCQLRASSHSPHRVRGTRTTPSVRPQASRPMPDGRNRPTCAPPCPASRQTLTSRSLSVSAPSCQDAVRKVARCSLPDSHGWGQRILNATLTVIPFPTP
jgi:hypothetical protein